MPFRNSRMLIMVLFFPLSFLFRLPIFPHFFSFRVCWSFLPACVSLCFLLLLFCLSLWLHLLGCLSLLFHLCSSIFLSFFSLLSSYVLSFFSSSLSSIFLFFFFYIMLPLLLFPLCFIISLYDVVFPFFLCPWVGCPSLSPSLGSSVFGTATAQSLVFWPLLRPSSITLFGLHSGRWLFAHSGRSAVVQPHFGVCVVVCSSRQLSYRCYSSWRLRLL